LTQAEAEAFTSLSARTGGGPARSASTRVGIDLCSVADVAYSVATFGDRYLQRVYTADEIEYCGRDPLLTAERLAARFAAKEAAVKVLRPRDARPEWRDIEVQRDPGGWCELALTGSAAVLAEEAAITSLSVSLTHEAGLANAVVVATLDQHEADQHEADQHEADQHEADQQVAEAEFGSTE
jgi:holo-[acyl-carrier protein] synthase